MESNGHHIATQCGIFLEWILHVSSQSNAIESQRCEPWMVDFRAVAVLINPGDLIVDYNGFQWVGPVTIFLVWIGGTPEVVVLNDSRDVGEKLSGVGTPS